MRELGNEALGARVKGVEASVILQRVGTSCCFASASLEGAADVEGGGENEGWGGYGGWAKGIMGQERGKNGGNVGDQTG